MFFSCVSYLLFAPLSTLVPVGRPAMRWVLPNLGVTWLQKETDVGGSVDRYRIFLNGTQARTEDGKDGKEGTESAPLRSHSSTSKTQLWPGLRRFLSPWFFGTNTCRISTAMGSSSGRGLHSRRRHWADETFCLAKQLLCQWMKQALTEILGKMDASNPAKWKWRVNNTAITTASVAAIATVEAKKQTTCQQQTVNDQINISKQINHTKSAEPATKN